MWSLQKIVEFITLGGPRLWPQPSLAVYVHSPYDDMIDSCEQR